MAAEMDESIERLYTLGFNDCQTWVKEALDKLQNYATDEIFFNPVTRVLSDTVSSAGSNVHGAIHKTGERLVEVYKEAPWGKVHAVVAMPFVAAIMLPAYVVAGTAKTAHNVIKSVCNIFASKSSC